MNRMIFYGRGFVGLLLVQVLLFGCATAPMVKTERGPERFRNFATEYEKKGDLRLALLNWEIVVSLGGSDAEAASKISALKAQILSSSAQHFKSGVDYYKRNMMYEARKEFLLTLNLTPDNAEALGYLKNRLAGEDVIQYTVKKGDTIKGIAQKNYGDQQKGFLIAYFNNLGIDAKLVPGSLLTIPILEPTLLGKQIEVPAEGVVSQQTESKPMSGKTPDAKGAIGEAISFYDAREYLRAIAITDKILQSEPSRKDARDLKNTACYQRGKGMMREEKYAEALKMFECVEPGYKDGNQLASVAKKRLADAHYIRGVELFMYDKLDEAIEEWKTTLSIDPNHPKASSDIDNTQVLLKKLKEI